jgi:hypothetical protein
LADLGDRRERHNFSDGSAKGLTEMMTLEGKMRKE